MTQLKTFLTVLSLSLISSGCVWTKPDPVEKVVTKTEYVYNRLETQPRPDPIALSLPKFLVVSDENLQEFLDDIKLPSGETVFIAIKIRDYEKLSLNVAELKRYIQQQKNLIIYYEEIITENNNNAKE